MRVGIITLYRGYNYGTSLQAYALREFIKSLGYDAEIIWTDENTSAGRDIRIGKIFRMAARSLVHPQLLKITLAAYKKAINRPMADSIKKLFLNFADTELCVRGLSKNELQEYALSEETVACVCGSDQIWSAVSANVDSMYYLQFSPEKKRIAYAPSFGSDTVPSYNRNIIARYLKSIPSISVREIQGCEIVKEMTGSTVPVLIDPTLLLDWDDWIKEKNRKYIIAYFLDPPSEFAIKSLKEIVQRTKMPLISFPYTYDAYSGISQVEHISVGPKEFVDLIGNADCVLTDSFHGVTFSINMETPFWVFERSDKTAARQSSRITSLLKLFGFSNQYITRENSAAYEVPVLDFEHTKNVIENQRAISKNYILTAIEMARN